MWAGRAGLLLLGGLAVARITDLPGSVIAGDSAGVPAPRALLVSGDRAGAGPTHVPVPARLPSRSTISGPGGAQEHERARAGRGTPWPGDAPTRLRLRALGVNAPVVPVAMGADGSGALVPPADPGTLGWWTGGAAPGATGGTVLVIGHTVHTSEGVPGGGALDDLETVIVGDTVEVATDSARVRYRVERVRVLSKAELAQAAYRLFGPTPTPRLVLVTCEDWDGTGYRSNVVVLATPVAGG